MSNTHETIGPVLITGCNGFIGRAIVDELLARGETVVGFDRTPTGYAPSNGHFVYETGDIRDAQRVADVVQRNDVRAILNLAALIIPACKEDPVLGAEVDVIGHINILEAARKFGLKKLVYTSSVAAKPRAPYNSPINLYGIYKRACEDISKVYYLDYGLPSVGVRPNIIYGPGRKVGETAFVSQAVAAAVAGRPFEMPFTGSLCLQHIDEITDVLVRCLYTVPDDLVVSDITTDVSRIDEVIELISEAIPTSRITPSSRVRPAPSGLDNTQLRKLLGVWSSVSLKEGIRRTIEVLQREKGRSNA